MRILEYRMFSLKDFLFKERSFNMYNFGNRNQQQPMQNNQQQALDMMYPPAGYVPFPGALKDTRLVRKFDLMKKELITKGDLFNLYDEAFNAAITGFNMHTEKMVINPHAEKRFQRNKVREIHLPMYLDLAKNKFYHSNANDMDTWKPETLPNGAALNQTELFRFPGYVDDHILKQFTPSDNSNIQDDEVCGIIKMKKSNTNLTMRSMGASAASVDLIKTLAKRKAFENTNNHIIKNITPYDIAVYRFFNFNYHNSWKKTIIRNTLNYIDQWLLLYALDIHQLGFRQAQYGHMHNNQPTNTNSFR